MSDIVDEEHGRLSRAERWSDRLNPILVREVVQAMTGRIFMLTLAGAVLAVVLVTFANIWLERDPQRIGREVFSSCLMCLAPILLFIVPMQAFLSMRQEVSGGTTEQLMLTHLSPLRIVTGKLAASFSQFVLFLAVFAPAMALTFLLRGVDVPTIALMLFFAALASLTATTGCIAFAAVSRVKVVSALMQVLAPAALFIATMSGIVGSWELPRDIAWLLRSDELWLAVTSITAMFCAAIALFGIVATTSLAHAYENRSTPYRVFAAAAAVVLFALLAWNVPVGHVDEAMPAAAIGLALGSLPIWLFACCEDAGLSPRLRARAPRTRWLARLLVPWLPGGNRGLLFTWLYGAVVLALGAALPFAFGRPPDADMLGIAAMAWCYVAIYAVLASTVRRRLGGGTTRSFIAFAVTLFTLAVVSLVPLFIELVVRGGRSDWSPLHALNPFYTIAENDRWREHRWILAGLAVLVAIAFVVSLPRMVAGARELLRESDRRRAERRGDAAEAAEVADAS